MGVSMNIDYEKLRKDLIDYFGTAMFSGFGMAMIDIVKIKKASNEELIEFAKEYKIDLSKYIVN